MAVPTQVNVESALQASGVVVTLQPVSAAPIVATSNSVSCLRVSAMSRCYQTKHTISPRTTNDCRIQSRCRIFKLSRSELRASRV